MDRLNYHHLRYFREVAREGNLTRVAERVNLSQSALSTQIKTLEERLGHALFERAGRSLALTEVGHIVLDYADQIFATGEELVATLNRQSDAMPPLRVGALSTLSRNFQMQFLRPILADGQLDIVLASGSDTVLLDRLQHLALDVVLTTEPARSGQAHDLTSHRLAEQSVGLHGAPTRLNYASLADLLSSEPVILPTESSVRTGFDSLVARLDITPRIAAQVDDMAMVRLLARENVGIAVAPSVVLADEIASGLLQTAPFDLDIVESFYAITVRRSFPHPALAALINPSADGRDARQGR
ncbi:MAG: LysR family transcriptional regulator [Ahrensia sp.]